MAASLATFSLFLSGARDWLSGWLRSKTVDQLYATLHEALWLVIVGVIIDEWKLLKHFAKFIRYSFTERFREALTKAWAHRDEIVEGFGFSILVIGLAGELAIAPLIETSQKTELQAQQKLTADANKAAGEAYAKAESFSLEIAKSNERANALELESLKLREQLIAQGPREALLRGTIRNTLVNSLKPFAGQKIDVRHSVVSAYVPYGGAIIDIPIGDDTVGLSQTLLAILRDANWDSPRTPLPTEMQGRGLKVEVLRNASSQTVRAAKALVEALRKVPLGHVEGPLRVDEKQAKRVGSRPILPAFGDNTMILDVLTHP